MLGWDLLWFCVSFSFFPPVLFFYEVCLLRPLFLMSTFFITADLESEDWGLGSDVTSAPIKTEPAVGAAPGLTPSISLTATASAMTVEGEESPLQEDGTVWCSMVSLGNRMTSLGCL